MRLFKQFSTVATIVAVLAMPLGFLGCAQETPPADTPAAGDADTDAGTDAEMDSELGEPEGGTNL